MSIESQKRSAKKYRDSHLELCRDRERLWRSNNKDKRAAAARRRRASDPEKEQLTNKRRRFENSLIKAKHAAMKDGFAACTATALEIKTVFTGYCFVCNLAEGKTRLHMDHCHKTGKFRGWLCHNCNIALGLLNDSPSRLEKLLYYLNEKS